MTQETPQATGTEVRFYHLLRKTLDDALPEILGKAFATGRRVVVRVPDQAEAERLCEHLWTRDPNGFLPHGTKKDGKAEHQPIWITDRDENPNGAEVLVLTHGTDCAEIGAFTLCCDLFDGRRDEAVQAARGRWKVRKDLGYAVTYWKQDDRGKWEKLA